MADFDTSGVALTFCCPSVSFVSMLGRCITSAKVYEHDQLIGRPRRMWRASITVNRK